MGLSFAMGGAWLFLGRPQSPSGPEDQEFETLPNPPGPPETVLAVPGNGRVLLTWTPPRTDGGSPILGYSVYEGAYPVFEFLAHRGDTRPSQIYFTDVVLENSVAYNYQVVAFNDVGLSEPSDLITVVPGHLDTYLLAIPRFGVAPLKVEFTLSSLSSNLRDLNTTVWYFGDGNSTTLHSGGRSHNMLHTYTRPGTYLVTTSYGAEDSENLGATIPIVVLPPLTLEVTTGPTTGIAPLTVDFSANVSGGLLSYKVNWTWGDGASNLTRAAKHTYEASGNYTVAATARDALGNSAVRTVNISVEALPRPGAAATVDLFWMAVVPAAVGASGFVLGWLFGTRRRSSKK